MRSTVSRRFDPTDRLATDLRTAPGSLIDDGPTIKTSARRKQRGAARIPGFRVKSKISESLVSQSCYTRCLFCASRITLSPSPKRRNANRKKGYISQTLSVRYGFTHTHTLVETSNANREIQCRRRTFYNVIDRFEINSLSKHISQVRS